MKALYLSEEEKKLSFVKEAANFFSTNPTKKSYTSGNITPGEFFALRWGYGEDCILIFKLSEDFIPELYQQVIKEHNSNS